MASRQTETDASLDKLNEVATSLEHIKRLLIFSLLRNDVSQAELGAALGMSQSTVSRLVPAGKPAKRKR
jgi:DNA-directed RNA polymerase specialized sigma subunit